MKELEKLLAAIATFNASSGSVFTLVAALRHPDGSLTVVDTLDKADEIFKANEDQAKAWLDAHPQEQAES